MPRRIATPLPFTDLPTITEGLEPPRLPFFDRSGRQVYRCGVSLFTRYSDLKSWCERHTPEGGCHCMSAEAETMTSPKTPAGAASAGAGGSRRTAASPTAKAPSASSAAGRDG